MKFNFSPSKEFKEKTRERYLAAFDAHYPAATARTRPSGFVLALRAFAVFVGIVAVALGGTSVYADAANVPADSPLYPLKRLGESAQLVLVSPAAKPQLEATFAARRADEIADLTEHHPMSTLIPKLAGDLNNAINASLNDAENEMKQGSAAVPIPPRPLVESSTATTSIVAVTSTAGANTTSSGGVGGMRGNKPRVGRLSLPMAQTSTSTPRAFRASGESTGTPVAAQQPFVPPAPTGTLKSVCGTLGSFLNPTSSFITGGLLGHSDALQRFKNRCDLQGGGSSLPNMNIATTSTVSNGASMVGTAPTSTISTSTEPANPGSSPRSTERRGGDSRPRIHGGNATTSTATPSITPFDENGSF